MLSLHVLLVSVWVSSGCSGIPDNQKHVYPSQCLQPTALRKTPTQDLDLTAPQKMINQMQRTDFTVHHHAYVTIIFSSSISIISYKKVCHGSVKSYMDLTGNPWHHQPEHKAQVLSISDQRSTRLLAQSLPPV